MQGLYGSTEENDFESAKLLSVLRPDSVRNHPTIVIKDTALERLFTAGKFVPLSLKRAILICGKITGFFEGLGIRVIRNGIFIPSEFKENIIAGPFSESFGDFVKIQILINSTLETLSKYKGSKIYLNNKEYKSLFSHKGFFLEQVREFLPSIENLNY